MNAKEIIARRIAQEIVPGSLVNLGIGLPTKVAQYIDKNDHVFFQSENGVIGAGGLPEGMENPSLTDAGGSFIGVLPGAAAFDSAFSFGLIRGGHLDMTILGGLQVDEQGHLANWIIPEKMIPGMGGAMDLVAGAKRVIVAMTHTAKGQPKVVASLAFPMTGERRVDLIVTEKAVIQPTENGLLLKELGPGCTLDEVISLTGATLIIPNDLPHMQI